MYSKRKDETSTLLAEKIRTKALEYQVQVGGSQCIIHIEDALHGSIEGKEVVLDEMVIQEMVHEIARCTKRNATKYNPVPSHITISHGLMQKETREEQKASENHEEAECVMCYEPKCSLEDIYLEADVKRQILSVLSMVQHKDKLFHEWGLEKIFQNGRGIILNFYGKPGTGKSATAEAIAKYVGKKVCAVNYSELESKYVGETPKNIKNIFKVAKENDAVIIFDEADSFLGKRLTNVSQSADYGVNITRSVMLLELEKYDGIVIFTTNLLNNYDDAFKRRILSSIEFKIPDEAGRLQIWTTHLPESLPIAEGITPQWLAMHYEGVTGADIKDIILNAALLALQSQRESIEEHDFEQAFHYVMDRYAKDSQVTHIKSEVITKEQFEQEQCEMGDMSC